MNLLTIIYIIGALAFGFLIGTMFEIFADSEEFRRLNHKIHRLELELAEAKKQPEIIEIYDKWTVNATEPKEEISFPNTDGI